MPHRFRGDVAYLSGVCAIEEAEPLLEWCAGRARRRIHLARCEHLHTAVLQVLLAAAPEIVATPKAPDLARLLAAMYPGATEGPCN